MSSILSHNTDMSATKLNVAQRVSATHAEGPGLRYAIWLRGCSLRCPGCCNPTYFNPNLQNPIDEYRYNYRGHQNIPSTKSQIGRCEYIGWRTVEQPQGLLNSVVPFINNSVYRSRYLVAIFIVISSKIPILDPFRIL